MDADVKPKMTRRRRTWLTGVALTLFVLVGIIGALRFFVTTTPGANWMETQINKRSFGAIKSIHVSGLSGDPLSRFSIETLTLSDENGIWLEANGVSLDWKPFAYLKDHILINTAEIRQTEIFRRPELTRSTSSGKKDSLKITLNELTLQTINLGEPVVGQKVSLMASGGFNAKSSGEIKAKIFAERLDAPGDSVLLDFSRTQSKDMSGVFQIQGAPSGPIAALMRAPANTPISGSGDLKGTPENGSGRLAVNFGGNEALRADTLWTTDTIDLNAVFDPAKWPEFAAYESQLGASVTSSIHVDRLANPRAFNAAINIPNLSLTAQGSLPEKGLRPERANIDLKTTTPSLFLKLPDGYDAKSAAISGEVSLASPYSFNGNIEVNSVTTPRGIAGQISGPVSAKQINDDEISFTAKTRLTSLSPSMDLRLNLSKNSALNASGSYLLKSKRLNLSSAQFTSGSNRANAKGWINARQKTYAIDGTVTAELLARGQQPAGALQARVKAVQKAGAALSLISDGVFQPTSDLPAPLSGLIGSKIDFTVDAQPNGSDISLTSLNVTGQNVRAAMNGTVGEMLNLSGEILLPDSFEYQSAILDAGTEISFEITGPRSSPAVRFDAQSQALTYKDYVFKKPRLRSELVSVLTSPQGAVQLNAGTPHGDLSFGANLQPKNGGLSANNITLGWGRLAAGGNVEISNDKIASGELALKLPEKDGQFARAALTLTNLGGVQGLSLDINAEKIAAAGFQFDTFNAKADGTLDAMQGAMKATGQRGEYIIARRFNLDSDFRLTRETGGTLRAYLSPKILYGDINIAAKTPIEIYTSAGKIGVTAPISVADGTIDVTYEKSETQELIEFAAANLPVTLIPMPGNLADTRGRIGANISASLKNGSPLNVDGSVIVKDWRGFDVPKGQGLTNDFRLTVRGKDASMSLDGGTAAGFTSKGELNIPLLVGASLFETRIHMNGNMSGAFSASGEAAAIFGLFTPSDSELGGELFADVEVSGTPSAPQMNGKANGKDIQFEAPEFGTQVRSGRFDMDFTNESLTLNELYMGDTNGGNLSGSGKFILGDLGRPIGEIDITAVDFHVLDRKDVDASMKGTLKYTSAQKNAALSGDIEIGKADVKQFISGNLSVVEIEVEEINRPENIKALKAKPPSRPINLDIHIRAPRRIFVRSRGLDVEMSVDATLKGTLVEPLFYGEAKVLRGGYKIAGKTLEFTDGTIIFNGDLANAKVDFQAATETQNLDASVTITGTVEAPEIKLSSTPERPQDEILAALLFGRSATELSTIEAAQLAGALAQMSGKGGGFDLLGGLRDAFGIGQLSINFGADGSAQLVGGRYLAKNVYLQIFSGAGPDQTGAVIDWEIRKNIALRSKIRADNDQSLSLKWKRDF